jgi:hypothetical protein
MNANEFIKRLESSTTEEEVKAAYAAFLKIKYNTSSHHDLYTENALFEFKADRNFMNHRALATTLAQALYYVRRLKFAGDDKPIPYKLCLADKDEAVLTDTSTWSTYYCNDAYDWTLAPSKPDRLLVEHLMQEPTLKNLHVFNLSEKTDRDAFQHSINQVLYSPIKMSFGDKKEINEENFEAVFSHWDGIIGKDVINGYKKSFYFLSNIQEDKIIVDKDQNRVVFTFEDRNSKTQKILMKDYDYFWSMYEHVRNPYVIAGIHAKLDRLTDESQRRFEGEFFTPLHFGLKAIHYLTEVLGKDWYKSDKFRIWDMAAGTGNLEYHLPADAYKYLYLSTLHNSEVDHLKRVFPEATCFQYDYLNDDVDYVLSTEPSPFVPTWKLPKQLRDDLQRDDITWVVFINPPFATAQDAGAQGKSKAGVNKTHVERYMEAAKTGHAKRELFVQFMFRIKHELPAKTYLGVFSKLKYLNAPDSIDFRDQFFEFKYERGFLFKSTVFHGVKGKYPIGFLIWNLSHKRISDIVDIDVCDDDGTKIGTKHLRLVLKTELLNNWFPRPKNSNSYILPALSNAINVKENNRDARHRARPDFLASISSNGNDFQSSKQVSIRSAPCVSAGAFTVTPEVFERALVLHAVRKIPKPTWLNDRDQFLIPQTSLPSEFIINCVVWSLFASSNETAALRNVSYMGDVYQINNHFFPFSPHELKTWTITDHEIRNQISNAKERFVTEWLSTKTLSPEAQAVIDKARNVYREFYSNMHQMITQKWKIETWDAGWYQIRRCLEEHRLAKMQIQSLREVSEALANNLAKKIEEYGFLEKDEMWVTKPSGK